MDKNEILKRAQTVYQNKPDEMELQIEQKGSFFAMGLGMIACIILMIAKIKTNQPWHDIYAIYCLMVGTRWTYKWQKLRRNSDLKYAICWTLTGLFLLCKYLITIL